MIVTLIEDNCKDLTYGKLYQVSGMSRWLIEDKALQIDNRDHFITYLIVNDLGKSRCYSEFVLKNVTREIRKSKLKRILYEK